MWITYKNIDGKIIKEPIVKIKNYDAFYEITRHPSSLYYSILMKFHRIHKDVIIEITEKKYE